MTRAKHGQPYFIIISGDAYECWLKQTPFLDALLALFDGLNTALYLTAERFPSDALIRLRIANDFGIPQAAIPLPGPPPDLIRIFKASRRGFKLNMLDVTSLD